MLLSDYGKDAKKNFIRLTHQCLGQTQDRDFF